MACCSGAPARLKIKRHLCGGKAAPRWRGIGKHREAAAA